MPHSNEDRECSDNEPIVPIIEEGTDPAVPDYTLTSTIEQSRKLIRESQRLIVESYRFESK